MKRGLTILLVLLMMSSLVLSACGQQSTDDSNSNGSDSSSSDSSSENSDSSEDASDSNSNVTLKIARQGWTDVRPPAEEMWMWKRYEEMTGIHVEWEEIPREGYEERKNIIIAANDLPDAFYQAPFSTDEIGKYGSQGTFISLSDLIEQNGPSIKEMFEQYPSIEKGLTMPDGNIYSLPYVCEDTLETSRRYNINKKWMDNLSLEVPSTVEELSNVLEAFKTQDANGNGDADDEYPLYFHDGMYNEFEMNLAGSFGLVNRGMAAGGEWIDLGPDGKVRFYPTDERMKELWQQMKEWWDAGYFHPETFSGIDYARWAADGSDDKIGLFSWNNRYYVGEKVGENYIQIPTFKGPHGDAIYAGVHPLMITNWSFMITSANQYPEETIKWVDFFYSPEGSMFGYFGEEDVTYNLDENGNPVYIDEILNYEGGAQLGAFQWVDNVYGGCYPFIEPPIEKRLAARGTNLEDFNGMAADAHLPFMPEEIWPAFPPTPEESEEISALLTDINAYIEEMRVKFITGEMSLDSDWDTYVETLNKMGLERYIEIKQQQYERYSQ